MGRRRPALPAGRLTDVASCQYREEGGPRGKHGFPRDERLGFQSRGVRRGYYTDNREDALIMWRDPELATAAS
jgi:hypothetical protein